MLELNDNWYGMCFLEELSTERRGQNVIKEIKPLRN